MDAWWLAGFSLEFHFEISHGVIVNMRHCGTFSLQPASMQRPVGVILIVSGGSRDFGGGGVTGQAHRTVCFLQGGQAHRGLGTRMAVTTLLGFPATGSTRIP